MHLFDMKEWIISITSIVLITSVLSLILPHGKIGKFIKGVFSILFMFVVIKPITYFKEESFNFEDFINTDEIILQDNYLDYVYCKRVEDYKANCVKIIEKLGIKNSVVNIDYIIDEVQKLKINFIKINLQNSVIISDKQHINIKEEIITEIASYLNINKNSVIIYE